MGLLFSLSPQPASGVRHPGFLWNLTRRRISIFLVMIILLTLVACRAETTPRPAHISYAPRGYALVGVKQYYLALGDSLAFGYQPDTDFTHGYAAQWEQDLQQYGSKGLVDYGCGGETTSTFAFGQCPIPRYRQTQYRGTQLDAALQFLKTHAGQVSPVTLDIGSNDLLPDFNLATCTVKPGFQDDLAAVDDLLNAFILPKLLRALSNPAGHLTGDLVLLNYYNPYVGRCKNSAHFVEMVNEHLAMDAAQYHLPIADVYQAFGGATGSKNLLCWATWMCGITPWVSTDAAIHPTTEGYHLITQALSDATGY